MGSPQAGVETLRDCAPWWQGSVIAIQGSQPGEVTPADRDLVLEGKFLSKRKDPGSKSWKERDPSWGNPVGRKAIKDGSVTSSTKSSDSLLCARQRLGLSSCVEDEELAAQPAEDLLMVSSTP